MSAFGTADVKGTLGRLWPRTRCKDSVKAARSELLMSPKQATREAGLLLEALSCLEKALGLLDEGDAPGRIGAQVDHAIHQLRDTLGIFAASGNGSGEPNDSQAGG